MKINKIILGLLLSFSIMVVSCKKETTALEQTPNTETTTTTVADSLQPVKTETGTVALNPAHGQPNHRCDIAVGAPLNTLPTPGSFLKPTQTQQTPASTTNTVQTTTTSPTGVKPKLNPAHGQPYHRCDLKVGDPLPDA